MKTTPEIAVKKCPAIELAGFKIKTSMADAFDNCGRLWSGVFCSQLEKFGVLGKVETYGVSNNFNPATSEFEYWAALPRKSLGKALPGMESLQLPAGLYAEYTVKVLADLSAAFGYMYEKWLPASEKYALNTSSPCYELYPMDYSENAGLSLFIPVIEK